MQDTFYDTFDKKYTDLDKSCPGYLYHYTTLQKLALILDSKKFRFTRLDILNDPLEGRVRNGKSLSDRVGQSSYVSCWTQNERDEIPMWKLYTDDLDGIRLRLRSHLFHQCLDSTGSAHSRNREDTLVGTVTRDNVESPRHYQISLLEKNGIERIDYDAHPMQVVYDDCYLPEFYKNYEADLGNGPLDLYTSNWGALGRIKKEDWQFEQEWRFRIFLLYNRDGEFIEQGNKSQPLYEDENVTIATDALYIRFHPETFQGAELRLGPKCTEAHRILVESLLKSFNISQVKITQSKIKIY